MRVFVRRTLLSGVLAFPDAGAAVAQQMSQTIPPAASTLNSGDTAWMLTSTALVLMMTIAGLAIGLRVDSDIEREGLDLAIHGEAVQ
jgi:hypothetical protein